MTRTSTCTQATGGCGVQLCRAALSAVLLAVVMAPRATADDQPADLEGSFHALLDSRRYELARKLAIVQFRPDLHCEVYLHQAATLMSEIDRELDRLEATAEVDGSVLDRQEAGLAEARALCDRALSTAEEYVLAGVGVELGTRVRRLREEIVSPVLDLEQRIETLRGKAKSLAALLVLPQLGHTDVANLEPPDRLIMGLHIAERGRFDDAVSGCFVPLRLEADGALKAAAATASEILEKWHEPAFENRKWNNLVEAGLDAHDALREAFPERPELAGWMACLAAHLARDHYDVSPRTIRESLKVIEAVEVPSAASLPARLLQAKLAHERFLLRRRNEQWHAERPPAEHVELFDETHTRWYAAEAALIEAAAGGGAAGAWVDRVRATIETIRADNAALADGLGGRLERYEAIHQPFGTWLEIARRPGYRDTRGTVLPDVLVETRDDLIGRVRAGFESAIADTLATDDIDRAFRLAQQAKALSVGRTLTADGAAEPRPISAAELLETQLMSTGLGGERSIARRELFIEYFVGPGQAWAFYLFAPGDDYEPMAVVELDHAGLTRACRDAIAALQAGRVPDPPGRWLLSGQPELARMWSRLSPTKQGSDRMPRMVVAPDGPLCFLPLHADGLDVAADLVYLPTAAVLLDSRYMDARRDARLLWESQRGDLTPEPVWVKPLRDKNFLVLWPDVELELLLRDR